MFLHTALDSLHILYDQVYCTLGVSRIITFSLTYSWTCAESRLV